MKNSKNANEIVQISISLTRGTLEKIDKLAAAECRNRSNFISVKMAALPAPRRRKGGR